MNCEFDKSSVKVIKYMLAIENLEVVYQDVILVLRGVSLEIKKGEIVALLGSNGAGKTTVIRSITGLLDVQNGDITKGSISVDGEDITNLNPSKIVEKGIAQVLEGRRIFSELTVIENLRLGGHTNSNDIKDNIEKVLDLFPILKERSKGEAGYLSGGEQQMLAIGRALMSDPSYLLLDEPSLGLAPKLVDEVAELIKEINSQGVTVLLVEQNANMALNISDHGYIMETGNVVMDNKSSMLLNDEDVREFYLGLNAEGTKRKSFKDVKHYKRKKRWLS
ncbi:ABC transporter ATP-binding protein [Acidimicrobiaceae bacterium]|nr:ABC transporter ATP-binding protein [Acidimicrobiaceae bacterium]